MARITNNNKPPVETTDTALAAALVCKGYELVACKPMSDARFIYCFTEAEGIYDAVRQFRDGQMLVEPGKYAVTMGWICGAFHKGECHDD